MNKSTAIQCWIINLVNNNNHSNNTSRIHSTSMILGCIQTKLGSFTQQTRKIYSNKQDKTYQDYCQLSLEIELQMFKVAFLTSVCKIIQTLSWKKATKTNKAMIIMNSDQIHL